MLSRSVGRRILIVGSLIVIVGISALWIRPLSTTVIMEKAWALPENSDYVGRAQISTSDAIKIADREFYVKGRVFDCEVTSDYYPAELRINEVPLDNFTAVRSQIRESKRDKTFLSFIVPKRIYEHYRQPCLSLNGGQMVGFSRFKSNTVPIQ